jgi:hypothetical protein
MVFLYGLLLHILSVLTHLFNFVITSSSFPTAWKTAIVLYLHKSGAPTGLADFCPIIAFVRCFKRGLGRFSVISSCGILSRF